MIAIQNLFRIKDTFSTLRLTSHLEQLVPCPNQPSRQFLALRTEPFLQKLSLTSCIPLKVRARVAIEMSTWKDMQLLWLHRTRVCLDSQRRRCEDIVFGNGQE